MILETVTVGDYLISELQKIGITEIFGLPGDYNFNLIDAVEKNPDVKWIGCTNELNAGYAADGYARVKGYGAVLTTFGVGELSAINAVAGSFAENVPVIMIVGAPETKFIRDCVLKHHNFMEPDYFAFESAYSNVVQSTAFLDYDNPKAEIDRVLDIFVKEKKPVYIAVPADVCLFKINNDSKIKQPQSNEVNLQESVEFAYGLIKRAQHPIVLADALIERNLAVESFEKFIENSGIPVSSLVMGKGIADENSDSFIGTYLGHFMNKEVYDAVNSSDCIISVGTIFSDFNTFGFDFGFNPCDFIQILGSHVIIQNQVFEEVYMKDFLETLSDRLEYRTFSIIKSKSDLGEVGIEEEKPLNFEFILPRLEKFIKSGDLIFVDTGVLAFASAMLTMPRKAVLYNQFLWASIGWATPAVFGASIAVKNEDRRVVLLTGEGAHQLTVQSLSSMIYHRLKPVIIVLNNKGYTIERALSNTPQDNFNDIAEWDYTKLPEVFKGSVWAAKASTNREFDKVLKLAEKESEKQMCYIEIFTDKMDLPVLMKKYIEYEKSH